MAELNIPLDDRLLVGVRDSEDAAVVTFPPGRALVQTVDFFTPIVDDPYQFGQIAAANALSDVYAMGGEPYSAMNIVCFPIKTVPKEILGRILKGGLDKVLESGAMLVGGHSLEDDEIKYGLSVSGTVDPEKVASNKGLRPGDRLVLTKPLGTGILATAIKGRWEGADVMEQELSGWAARLNAAGGEAIRRFDITGATDVTGFGLGGHLLEMARASRCAVRIDAGAVPVMNSVLELASMGLIPAGSFANKSFCRHTVVIHPDVEEVRVDLIFDAQTSGGMVLSVAPHELSDVLDFLRERGEQAAVFGTVLDPDGNAPLGSLMIVP
jgi:selenide,water dikinase